MIASWESVASYNVVPDQVASAPTEKPGFLNPRARIRNRVFAKIFNSNPQSPEKPGFLNPRENQKPGFFHKI
jgi:hypothetical protein